MKTCIEEMWASRRGLEAASRLTFGTAQGRGGGCSCPRSLPAGGPWAPGEERRAGCFRPPPPGCCWWGCLKASPIAEQIRPLLVCTGEEKRAHVGKTRPLGHCGRRGPNRSQRLLCSSAARYGFPHFLSRKVSTLCPSKLPGVSTEGSMWENNLYPGQDRSSEPLNGRQFDTTDGLG